VARQQKGTKPLRFYGPLPHQMLFNCDDCDNESPSFGLGIMHRRDNVTFCGNYDLSPADLEPPGEAQPRPRIQLSEI